MAFYQTLWKRYLLYSFEYVFWNFINIFALSYDNKRNKVRVRYQVAKYLLKKGCSRIQRSIDLTEFHSYYDNHNSILTVTISTKLLKSMKIIDVQSTLFLMIIIGITIWVLWHFVYFSSSFLRAYFYHKIEI